MSTSIKEIRLPKDAAVDLTSDRLFHESVKQYRESWGLPKACFFKLRDSRITSPEFLAQKPEIARIRQGRAVLGYAYQRANAAAEHGEPLVQKRFNLRESLAQKLTARADKEGLPQVTIVEQALDAWLG
jgi:hypothetical protein